MVHGNRGKKTEAGTPDTGTGGMAREQAQQGKKGPKGRPDPVPKGAGNKHGRYR